MLKPRVTPVLRIFDVEKALDGSPGSHVRIELEDVDAFCAELNAKRYRNARPGVEAVPWGNREMTIADPFGNRMTFWAERK
jgi:hypothetical protein